MNEQDHPPSVLVTPRQEAICRILSDAGLTESGTYPDGRRYKDAPPEGMAIMVDMALSAFADEDHLTDMLAGGNKARYAQNRALAQAILKVRDLDAPA